MATTPILGPIGWAQFRLLGGWKNLLTTALAAGLIGAAAMFALVKGVRQPAPLTFGYFINLFLGLQVLVLLIFGATRASGAVRGDMTSRMIESHRLMPAPPAGALLGYLSRNAN